MPFVFLILLTLACLPGNWPQPGDLLGLSPSLSLAAGLTWGGEAVLVLAAFLMARWATWKSRTCGVRRERLVRRYSSLRFYHMVAMLAFYGMALFYLGWGWAVQSLLGWWTPAPGSAGVGSPWVPGSKPIPEPVHQLPVLLPGAELLILAPFVAGLLLSWACLYDAETALHGGIGSSRTQRLGRWAYVLFRARQNLALLVAPLVLMIAVKWLQRQFAENTAEWVFELMALALLPVVFMSFPWILRLVLGLKPLPAGPLRDRLLAAARRLNFRFSDVLVWNTHGTVANAMVAGMFPRPRYVLLTDRLISELTPEEVEAVFGHEVGHIKHHHMLLYMTFLIISVSTVAQLVDFATMYLPGVKALLEDNAYWTNLPFIGLVGAYIFVVFGFLSRRCERQADIFGCRAVSCGGSECLGHSDEVFLQPGGRGLCPTGIRTFMDALDKVARLNGISRERQGWLQAWLHFTFAHRIEFLQGMLADPTLEARFQRKVRRVKWSLVLSLTAALALLLVIRRLTGQSLF